MAENIDVNVNVNTRDAQRNIQSLTNSINGLLAVLTGREVVQFADGITNLRNKLLTMTPSIDTVNRQFNALTAIAVNARTPLEETADLFFRISRASDQLGISQREAADITESVAKALSSSGLSAKEAAGPLLQLGQALQSGTFQGDELRSILEGLPVVSRALAQELDQPIGALKKLGSEGKISAEIFVRAMRRAKDSIDESFARTAPTIGQAFNVLKTTVSSTFDAINQQTGVADNFAKSVIYIAAQIYKLRENVDAIIGPLETFLKIVLAIGSFLAVGKIIQIFTKSISDMGRVFTAAVAAAKSLALSVKMIIHYIGRALGLITVNVPKNTVFDGLAKSLGFLGRELKDIVVLIGGALGAIGAFLGIDKLFDVFRKGTEANKSLNDEIAEFQKKLQGSKDALDETANAADALAQKQKAANQQLKKPTQDMQIAVNLLDKQLSQTKDKLTLENELFKLVNLENKLSQDDADIAKMALDIDIERRNAVQGLLDQVKQLNLEYEQQADKSSINALVLKGQIGIIQQQIEKTNQLYGQHQTGMENLTRQTQTLKILDEDRRRTQENIIAAIEKQISRQQTLDGLILSAQDKLKGIQFEGAQQKRSPLEQSLANIQEEARKAALEAGRAFAATFDGTELSIEQSQELANGLDLIAQKYKAIADAQTQNLMASRTWEQGWKDAFDSYMENATNAAKKAGEAFNTITGNMERAIDNFVTTGKFSFSDLARSIIQDLIKIELKAQATAMFKAIAGTAGTFLSSIFGFAEGGNPPVNKPSIVGEKGPELFIPKTAGTIIPNHAIQGAGAGAGAMMNAPITNNYITNNISAVDAKSVAQLFAENRKTLLGTVRMAEKELPYSNR